MAVSISPWAQVDRRAQLGVDVNVGPFCVIGPNVTIGDGCRLDNHVTILGQTTIGPENLFAPQSVIGTPPQDISWKQDLQTSLEIGMRNQFREGVTVNSGAPKEDGVTRIGNDNLFMTNSHVAHNCVIQNQVILVNGALLGGHVHVHDGAIVSGNSVVHHFSTLGKLCFVSGGCRVPHDVPPFMLAAGSDNPVIRTINLVGLKRHGYSSSAIRQIKLAHRLIYREHKHIEVVKQQFLNEHAGQLPDELSELFRFIDQQRAGRMGRGRDRERGPEADHRGQTFNSRDRGDSARRAA